MLTEENEKMVQQPIEETKIKVNLETPAPSICMNSKFVKVEDYMLWARKEGEVDYEPLDPNDSTGVGTEAETDDFVRADCRVITGIGVRTKPGNITTLRVAYRILNSETGLLGPIKYLTDGREPHHELEVWISPLEEENDNQVIMCGFGGRANPGDITTLRIWTRDILPDGTLSLPTEYRYGTAKDNALEAQIMVPNQGIIVGVGIRAASKANITHLKAWFGHLKLRQS